MESRYLQFTGNCAGVAQLVEQLICNQQVAGSTPVRQPPRYLTAPAFGVRIYNALSLDGLGATTTIGAPVGGVPEWPKGADCKSAGSAFVGSNPTPSTKLIPDGAGKGVKAESRFDQGGCSSMVEPQPSKLMMWVRSPSPAPVPGCR